MLLIGDTVSALRFINYLSFNLIKLLALFLWGFLVCDSSFTMRLCGCLDDQHVATTSTVKAHLLPPFFLSFFLSPNLWSKRLGSEANLSENHGLLYCCLKMWFSQVFIVIRQCAGVEGSSRLMQHNKRIPQTPGVAKADPGQPKPNCKVEGAVSVPFGLVLALSWKPMHVLIPVLLGRAVK